jgi:imidazolonepropionase-like amidohydrolase
MMCGSGTWGDLADVRMTLADFEAVRSAARGANLKIAVHTAAVDHPIMDQLVADGIDSLEHCYLISDDLLDRCVARDVLLVMTPLVSQSPEYYESIQLPAEWIACMRQTAKNHWPVVRKAVAKEARLALGTDFHSHLEFGGTWAVARELELYEEAGATPTQLLSLSSRAGAEWLGMGDELGLVEEGFLADLIVLNQNPLTEGASAFRGLRRIISRGDVFEPRPPEPPLGS